MQSYKPYRFGPFHFTRSSPFWQFHIALSLNPKRFVHHWLRIPLSIHLYTRKHHSLNIRFLLLKLSFKFKRSFESYKFSIGAELAAPNNKGNSDDNS